MDDSWAVRAPMIGTVVDVLVTDGAAVRAGQPVVVLESMKMEHLVEADASGVVTGVAVERGDTVDVDQPLVWLAEGEVAEAEVESVADLDLDAIRPDLAEVTGRQARTQDEARPDAVERRRRTYQRTARENIAD
ncbi:MAG TPA: acetyl-CoA carboxylase biotin carboxyl carrier protein subunit, partial [Acidimicrobiales bacterium]|nr:acetyl-CoA carboxylase biotin carboxyl carrier protein subunit [Acidimicrobiales bacterium]